MIWKYSKTFHQHPKIFKDFFACKIVLAANHHQPEIIQKLFRLQIALAANHQLYPGNFQRLFGQQQSTAATSSSNQQQQPAAAINSSNQQRQSTAATSSRNQQQQPAAAINSSNQQQQSTAATNISNQQQQLAATTNFHPTSSIYTIRDDFRYFQLRFLAEACPARSWYGISRPVAACSHRTVAHFVTSPFF